MKDKLIFKRKPTRQKPDPTYQYYRVRVSGESYNKILEVADESGESIKSIVDKMIEFAYNNIIFESEENE